MIVTTEQIDIVCKVAITLKRSPYTYTDEGVFFLTSEGNLIINFKSNEMQFINWIYYNEEIELQLLGICKMYNLKSEDYEE
jgi:YHS domain-containing protein